MMLANINQISVAESINERNKNSNSVVGGNNNNLNSSSNSSSTSTSTISAKDLKLLPISSRLDYLFEKSQVLSYKIIKQVCFNQNTMTNKDELNLVSNLLEISRFTNTGCFIYKSERKYYSDKIKQYKRNHLINLLSSTNPNSNVLIGVPKTHVIMFKDNEESLKELLKELAEYNKESGILKHMMRIILLIKVC